MMKYSCLLLLCLVSLTIVTADDPASPTLKEMLAKIKDGTFANNVHTNPN